MTTDSVQDHIRHARGQFIAMACTYSLGVFNDNFFKQAVLVLAVTAGRTSMQGYALAVFTLPFIVFAAPAGWLADRFPKRSVVVGAKWMELLAMLFGAGGIVTGNWPMVFVMLGIMGLQATVFSPSLNGSLPELYPESYLVRANGILRMLVTAAILAGVALAGMALDRKGTGFRGIETGRLLVAGTVVVVALVGVLVSYGIPRRPAAAPSAQFPWSGPVHTIRQLLQTWDDPILAVTIMASVFIWFVGSLEILLINPMGIQEFELSKTLTSALIVAQLGGLAIGGYASSHLVSGTRWHRVIGVTGMVMSALMISLAAVPWLPPAIQVPAVFVLITLIGASGGMFLIPVESSIQARPAPAEKGTVLAAANFGVFSGILISGFIANLLNALCAPTTSFGVLGCISFLVSGGFLRAFQRLERS